jgi:phosphoribosyl-AMP cyclohydrolase
LRSDQVAIGRLWWLLRALDSAGRGALPLDVVRQQLTGRNTPLRLCGWRQLRQLLQAGNGLFWQRDRETVWLRGAARVAHALGVTRVQYAPVTVKTADLAGPIGAVRAMLYATLHRSRPNAPIARATLQTLSGVSPSSQRSYEARAGIRAEAQYAIHFEQDTEKLAWRYGRALFRVTDVRGDHGVIGRKLILRQLPNCYHVPRTETATRRKRRLNRQLADLSQFGATGNSHYAKFLRRYCAGAREALANDGENVWQSMRRRLWYAATKSARSDAAVDVARS